MKYHIDLYDGSRVASVDTLSEAKEVAKSWAVTHGKVTRILSQDAVEENTKQIKKVEPAKKTTKKKSTQRKNTVVTFKSGAWTETTRILYGNDETPLSGISRAARRVFGDKIRLSLMSVSTQHGQVEFKVKVTSCDGTYRIWLVETS